MIDTEDLSTCVKSCADGDRTLASISAALNYNSGPRRLYSHRRSTNEKVADEENVTRESLLWFQSLKKHWLNSPRTPIQPILPIPATIYMEPSDPIAADRKSVV